jgi:hypothetical protein
MQRRWEPKVGSRSGELQDQISRGRLTTGRTQCSKVTGNRLPPIGQGNGYWDQARLRVGYAG